MIPEDYVFFDDMILDIGPKTMEKFSEIIKNLYPKYLLRNAEERIGGRRVKKIRWNKR